MTPFQWLFHYMEIKNMRKEDINLFLDKMDDLETSVQAFYLLVDSGKGKNLIDSISKVKNDRARSRMQDKEDNENEEYPDLLTDEDKELWNFCLTLPTTMSTESMKEETKFILPKKRRPETGIETTIVNSTNDIEKPKLGF